MSSKLHFINLNPLETPQSNKDTILWFLYLNWKSPGLSGIKYSKTTIFNWENKLETTSKPRRNLWLSFPQSRDSSYKFPGATVTDLWHQLQSRSRFLMEFPQTTVFLLRNAKVHQGQRRATQNSHNQPHLHLNTTLHPISHLSIFSLCKKGQHWGHGTYFSISECPRERLRM